MKALALSVTHLASELEAVVGLVCATNVPDFEQGTGFLFRKGEILQSQDGLKIAKLARFAPPDYSLHLLQMENDELDENAAGLHLAGLVAGAGLDLRGPIESRVNLVANRRGLLRIDVARLTELNTIEGVAVFTLYDGMAVNAGTQVAGAKVTPLVYRRELLQEAERLVAGRPLITVERFQPLRVGVLVREHLQPKPRARFAEAVRKKFAWFGATLLDIQVAENTDQIAAVLQDFKAQQADLILHVGGHATDPLDHLFPALQRLDVVMERLGAPAHPGTLFWLAYWQNTALFGLASCGMFSKTTLGDLLLARLLAGEHLTARSIAEMGYGGLFTREMAFRFPTYGLNFEE